MLSIARGKSSLNIAPHYLFYSRVESAPHARIVQVLEHFTWIIWNPTLRHPWPFFTRSRKLKLRFLFRWLLVRLGIMLQPECGAFVVYNNQELVHYSAFTSGYWRFPFMTRNDLQIGDTWTSPLYRGRGIAKFALVSLVNILSKPDRMLWYVVEADNISSIKVVESAGFTLVGEGTWKAPLGVKLMGSYRLIARRPVLGLMQKSYKFRLAPK